MSRLKEAKLAEMTIPELKALLQEQGLSTSGNKQALIDRLLMSSPTGPGVMVVETVSARRSKKGTLPPPPAEEVVPPEAPISEETITPATPPIPEEPAQNDAAALIAQLKELVAQAQDAVFAAQEVLAAAQAKKKEKKGKKKNKK